MARRSDRRDALLAATVRVVGERGVGGTTHRAVTEEAGVPLATASYYFSSIGELIAQALTAFVKERAEEVALRDENVSTARIAEWYASQVMGLEKDKRLAFYEVLIMGSLIQREGITTDFGKISRVIYNRLGEKIPLGFDST
ncbi:TetR/AcrR family transcriptional regulator, partial [Kibdelosporangium lantanae]